MVPQMAPGLNEKSIQAMLLAVTSQRVAKQKSDMVGSQAFRSWQALSRENQV